MTIKETILKGLDEINALTNYLEICNLDHIIRNNYYDFGTAKTPASTISNYLVTLFVTVTQGLNV